MVGDGGPGVRTSVEVVEESFDQVDLLVRDQIVDTVLVRRREGDLGE